jgi:hypothetical protein
MTVEFAHEKVPQTPVPQLRQCDRTLYPVHHLQPSFAEQPAGWGKFVVLLFLAALLFLLTQFQGLDMASFRNLW